MGSVMNFGINAMLGSVTEVAFFGVYYKLQNSLSPRYMQMLQKAASDRFPSSVPFVVFIPYGKQDLPSVSYQHQPKERKVCEVMWTLLIAFFLSLSITAQTQAGEVSNSGPIQVRREEESLKIQRAPAYDVETAREYFGQLPSLREVIGQVNAEEDLVFYGEKVPSEGAKEELRQALAELCQGDHFVSFMMVDAKSLSGAAYQCDVPFCTQSTIKAIYVGTLLENNPSALLENGQYMHDAIVYSDNDAYENLRTIYGADDLHRWFGEVGIDEGKADPLYPRNVTVKEMVKLWTRLYVVLNGENPDNFAAYYADSIASATSALLGEVYPLQTKAGWEIGLTEALPYNPEEEIPEAYRDKDPSNDECSINDTGVVYTPESPYFFAIFTDYPFGVFPDYTSPNPLGRLANALFGVQRSFYATSPE